MVLPFNVPMPWKKKPPPIIPPAPPTTPQPTGPFPGMPRQPGASTDTTQVPYINPDNIIAVSNKELIKGLFNDLIKIKTTRGISAEELSDELANQYNLFELLTGGKASPRLRETAAHLFFNATMEIYSDKPDVTEAYKATRTMIRKQLFPDVDAIQKTQYWEMFPNADLSAAKRAFFQDKDIPGSNFLVKEEILKSFDPQMLRLALDPTYAQRHGIGKTPPNEEIESIMKDIQLMWTRELDIDRVWGRTPEILSEATKPYTPSRIQIDLSSGVRRAARSQYKQTAVPYTTTQDINKKFIDQVIAEDGPLEKQYVWDRILGDYSGPYEDYVKDWVNMKSDTWDENKMKTKANRIYSKYKNYMPSKEAKPAQRTEDDYTQEYLNDPEQVFWLIAMINASRYPIAQQSEIMRSNYNALHREAKKIMPQDYDIWKTEGVPTEYKNTSKAAIASRVLETAYKNNWIVPSVPELLRRPAAGPTGESINKYAMPDVLKRRAERKRTGVERGLTFPQPPKQIADEPY